MSGETEPMHVRTHITAEVIKENLIVGAIGLLKNMYWGFKAYLLSMGMLQWEHRKSRIRHPSVLNESFKRYGDHLSLVSQQLSLVEIGLRIDRRIRSEFWSS